MASKKAQEVIDLLGTLAGGGLAGYADVKFANKQLAGLPPGAIAGIALTALGLSGIGSEKVRDYAKDAGAGMLAFEVGTMVAQRTLKSMLPAAAPATPGTSGMFGRIPGVGALPQGGVVSQQELMAQMAQLQQMQAQGFRRAA